MQPEIRSFVSVLRSPVTPFDRSKTKNANCFEERATFLATESVNSVPFKRGETKVQIFGKKVQNSSPILRWKFLARKGTKFIANFSATKVTSLPSLSPSLPLSLSLSVSLSLSLSLSH